jgi:hypothetical protein
MANLFKLLFFSNHKRRFAMEKRITAATEKTKTFKGLRNLDPERAGIDIGASPHFSPPFEI